MKSFLLICTIFHLLPTLAQAQASKKQITVNSLPFQSEVLPMDSIQKLDTLSLDFQFRGNCYAYSSDKNKVESNGEAHSLNLPKAVSADFPEGFYLFINQTEYCVIDSNYLGCKLYLINSANTHQYFNASDSRLQIVAEALDKNGEWMPISYLPSSFCGNSRHVIMLDKNEYWSFDIPIFKGSYKTKIRYSVMTYDNKKILSNQVTAYINLEQLNPERKQGHRNVGVMDPYDE